MQALALKYRPKSFDDLIGQDAIKDNLKSALQNNRLGHAYLFSGLRGSGKTSSARIFAKSLLCEHKVGANPCEICENCVAANEGRHMDIVEMDAASHRKIEDIRELIEQTRYSPVVGKYKIFIIDEAHMLTKEASNAFLKTLEEPPSHVKFILATTDPLKLLPTILSRTQHFRFKAIRQDDIIKHLAEILNKEQVSCEEGALKIIARSGSGSLRDTLTLLDQAIIFCNANISIQAITTMLGVLDPAKIDEILDVLVRGDRDELCALIRGFEASDSEMIITELIENLKEKFISPAAQTMSSHRFSLYIFEKFFKILSDAKNMLENGADTTFTLYVTLFAMRECLDISHPNIAQNMPQNMPSNIPQNVTQNMPSSVPQNIAQNTPQNTPQNTALPQETQSAGANGAILYERFLALICDRSYELGELFRHFIRFEGFEGGVIKLYSNAVANDAKMLKSSSKVLRQIANQVFGSENFKISKPQNDAQSLVNNLIQNNQTQITQKSQTEPEPQIIEPKENEPSNKPSSNDLKIATLNNLFGQAQIQD